LTKDYHVIVYIIAYSCSAIDIYELKVLYQIVLLAVLSSKSIVS